MTKKAVIQNITKKEFNEQYQNWSYGIKLDNGDEGFLSCKKEFTGGEEIEYEIEVLQSKAGKPYNKIKLPSSGNGFQGRGGGGYQKANPTENFPSFSLAYAKDLTVAKLNQGEKMDAKQMVDGTIWMADRLLDWLNKNKV